MIETLTIRVPDRVNSALLVTEIAAQVTTPFSMASGADDNGYFVRLTTDAPLTAEETALAQAIVAAHDPTERTDTQVKTDERLSVQHSAALVINSIDFDALDTQIDNMTPQEGIKGLSRGFYLLAVAFGMTDNTKRAEIAAQELAQYLGLIEAAK